MSAPHVDEHSLLPPCAAAWKQVFLLDEYNAFSIAKPCASVSMAAMFRAFDGVNSAQE
jgi:hypothetical protein